VTNLYKSGAILVIFYRKKFTFLKPQTLSAIAVGRLHMKSLCLDSVM